MAIVLELEVRRARKASSGWALVVGDVEIAFEKRKRDCMAWMAYVRDPTAARLAAIHERLVADLRERGHTPWSIRALLIRDSDPRSGTLTPAWLALVLEQGPCDAAAQQWAALTQALVRDHEATLAAEAEAQARAALEAEQQALAAAARRRAEQPERERASAIRAATLEIENIREHGEVDVRQADGPMPHGDVLWRDHPLVESWTSWASRVLALTERQRELLPLAVADASDEAAPRHAEHLRIVLGVWQHACEKATELPALMDLTGLPTRNAMLVGGSLDHLAKLLARCSSGTTLMVSWPVQSWVVARILRPRVGPV